MVLAKAHWCLQEVQVTPASRANAAGGPTPVCTGSQPTETPQDTPVHNPNEL